MTNVRRIPVSEKKQSSQLLGLSFILNENTLVKTRSTGMEVEFSGCIQKSCAQTLKRSISRTLRSDKRFSARSKEDNQGFHFDFQIDGMGARFVALVPDFAPKLCLRGVSGCISACFKTCKGPFDPILAPVL